MTAGGEPALAYDHHWGRYQTWALHPDNSEKFDLLWFEFHLECFMFAMLAAKNDSGEIVDEQFWQRAMTIRRVAFNSLTLETLRNEHGREGAEITRLVELICR